MRTGHEVAGGAFGCVGGDLEYVEKEKEREMKVKKRLYTGAKTEGEETGDDEEAERGSVRRK